MKFLLIDSGSLEEIINTRQYQSIEFEEGKTFISFLKGNINRFPVTASSVAIKSNTGAYILQKETKADDYIVFDFEEMPDLLKRDDSGILLAIQKTLRFCKKLLTGLSPSKNERVLSEGKAVIFPYPIGMQTSIRLTIDRNPDVKRRSKRESGQAYLVYKFGDNEGIGPSESPRVTNFRKASEGKDGAIREANAFLQEINNSKSPAIKSLSITELDIQKGLQLHEYGLENWRRWLTSSQMKFIETGLTAPHRIEGPAGTGKTLCLVLKAIHLLESAKAEGRINKSIFITHSQATKTAIENLFATNGGEAFVVQASGSILSSQSVEVTTLHELCAKLLHHEISDSELVDRDAYESKLTQKLYSIEAVEKTIAHELESHRPYLSREFSDFLENTSNWAIAEMLQHEMSVQIKGRAEQDLSQYKKLPPLKFGLPMKSDGDKAFVFLMYEEYQRELVEAAQFDTDDVVLSAMSQLGTPIWRRRRSREGFDSIFIDETHLFNINELSIFHKLTRSENSQPIAYSVDRSQALGDRGWTTEAFEHAFDPDQQSGKIDSINVKSIFRCSPEIIDLAFSVTSSGATLFTNFHNPLVAAMSAFSAEEERRCRKPLYVNYADDDLMFSDSFSRADSMAKEMGCQKADIAIIVFGDDAFRSMQRLSHDQKKPVEIIKSRGDLDAVDRAKQGGKYVLSAPEFVGGLEFSGVILVGVDSGRVPPNSSGAGESQAFLNYSAHQRLYVSITRAKYRVEILGVKARGMSQALVSAQSSGMLDVIDAA